MLLVSSSITWLFSVARSRLRNTWRFGGQNLREGSNWGEERLPLDIMPQRLPCKATIFFKKCKSGGSPPPGG